MKKLLALVFMVSFVFSNAQISEFEKADSRYERKKTALYKKYPKPNDLKTKQEWLLTEDKITSYKEALDKISTEEKKMIALDPPTKGMVTHEADYDKGKASFQKLLYEAVDLAFLNYASDSYKATISFVVDSKGNPLDAQVKGNNEDVNAFIEAAFYRIKDKGKWKPAENNGKPVSSTVSIPLVLTFKK
ncbi:MAG: energy transducer TonB [Chryseobacterium sp.]|uniref:energy transducer TonB n=1 Tax=Chryseobacterium sp. TaxID=1871047 RepID=UPI0025C6CA25|nr:energy transducer TonB [Chryseobacterium sp.]MCJ7934075.1 energy transducer TonB [Chryseobacterium sp.]